MTKRRHREFLVLLHAVVAATVVATVELTLPDSPVDDDETLRLKIDLVNGPVVRQMNEIGLLIENSFYFEVFLFLVCVIRKKKRDYNDLSSSEKEKRDFRANL
jgi:hypothetical protein